MQPSSPPFTKMAAVPSPSSSPKHPPSTPSPATKALAAENGNGLPELSERVLGLEKALFYYQRERARWKRLHEISQSELIVLHARRRSVLWCLEALMSAIEADLRSLWPW